MKLRRIGLKLRKFFADKRVRGLLKRLLLAVGSLVVALGVLLGAGQRLPRLLSGISVASSLLALPEGAPAMLTTREEGLPEPTPDVQSPSDSPIETSSSQEAVSGAIIDSEPPPVYYEVAEDDRLKILEETFSSTSDKNAVTYKNGTVKNYTENSPSSIEKILEKSWGETLTDDPSTVQVLIMHTHTTESYEPCDRDYCDKNYSARTLDERYNMVRVGEAIARTLSENGIGVVHDTTVHDYPSYNGSYERSAETVKGWLERYPTIKVVLDIHRDAIERTVSGETVRVKPVTEIEGKKAAQLMIIAGCDDGTMDMPNWEENLRFGAALQSQLETDWPTLMRPLMFDYRRYNQDLTTGSLLIEVGGHANALDEAVYSGELLAKSLCSLLKTYIKKNGEN